MEIIHITTTKMAEQIVSMSKASSKGTLTVPVVTATNIHALSGFREEVAFQLNEFRIKISRLDLENRSSDGKFCNVVFNWEKY